MKALKALLCLAALAFGMTAYAQTTEPEDSTYNIIEAINGADAGIYVIQPMEMERIVQHTDGKKRNVDANQGPNRVGYRVQVFSDNNLRTARANAEARKRLIESVNPSVPGYLTFVSPYWRVRMGNFTSRSEAEAYMMQLKSAFPQFSAEIRLVREPIKRSK